jgi:predicted Rossmann fold flavoprotein
MPQQTKILVIGGGPSGMMAAIIAARRGAYVTLVDRMPKIGKKLLATGAGQCNLCNTKPTQRNYHGNDTAFMVPALEAFGADTALTFFDALGIEVREVEHGRVFPITGQASNVLDVLRYEMSMLGIREATDIKIQEIKPVSPGFHCFSAEGERFKADKVVVAAGGTSSPNLGSNGGGYKMAAALGHHVTQTFPSRVPLLLETWFLARLKGVKVRDARVASYIDGALKRESTGDLLFTDYGISGPPVLNISRAIGQYERTDREMSISIDLFPGEDREGMEQLIRKRIGNGPFKPLDICLIGLLHKRLIPVLFTEAGQEDLSRPCGDLDDMELKRLIDVLKDWRVACKGTKSWMNSQVTAGGVDVSEVDGLTMESKLIPGLYFVGELLDIDGDCGGYNLQWAWSSGYAAGTHASG